MNAPRIESVTPLEGRYLLVIFVNRVQKIYDCQQILQFERFHVLKRKAFFNAVKVDSGGYGVSWDNETDLSEYELWNNSTDVEQNTVFSQEGMAAQGYLGR